MQESEELWSESGGEDCRSGPSLMGCRPFRLDMWDFRAISLLGARPGRHERRRRLLACRGTQPSQPSGPATRRIAQCSHHVPAAPMQQESSKLGGSGGDWLVFWCVIFDQHFAIGREKGGAVEIGTSYEGGHCGFWRVFIFSCSCHCSSLICFTTGIRQQRFCVHGFPSFHDTTCGTAAGFCTRHHGLPREPRTSTRASRGGNCPGMSHPRPD